MTTSTHAWRKAVRRVERRAAAYRSLAPLAYSLTGSDHRMHCPQCEAAFGLLVEATRTANRLAECAGILA